MIEANRTTKVSVVVECCPENNSQDEKNNCVTKGPAHDQCIALSIPGAFAFIVYGRDRSFAATELSDVESDSHVSER